VSLIDAHLVRVACPGREAAAAEMATLVLDGLAAASGPWSVLAAALCGKPCQVYPRFDPQLCEHLAQVRVHRVR
jgi:hypothetical protein